MITMDKNGNAEIKDPCAVMFNGTTICVTNPEYASLVVDALSHYKEAHSDRFEQLNPTSGPVEGNIYKVIAWHKGVKKTWLSEYRNGRFWIDDNNPIDNTYIKSWK